MRSFHPNFGQTQVVSATTTNQFVRFPDGLPQGEFQLRIYNAGTDAVAIRPSATVAASTADLVVPSGAIEVITVNNPQNGPFTSVAVNALTSTATVYITPGHGI